MPGRSLKFFAFFPIFLLILGGCGPKVEVEGEPSPKVKLRAAAGGVQARRPRKSVEAASGQGDVVQGKRACWNRRMARCGRRTSPRQARMSPKLYEAISAKGGLWESVSFVTPEGKKDSLHGRRENRPGHDPD